MMMPTFTTTLFQSGNNVGIEVPEDIVLGFGAGRRVPVSVEIAGYSYSSTIAVMGGRYLIPLASAHRTAAGVAGGQKHQVTVEHELGERVVEVPEDLAAALTLSGARASFDALAPSHRKQHMQWILDAKTPETRARRIAAAIVKLAH
jgi:hypothetical protein